MPTGSALNYLPTIAKKVCFQGSQIQTNLVFVLFPQQFEVFIFLHHHHPLLFHHHLFFIGFKMRTNTLVDICCSPKFEILNHQKSSSHSHHLPHYHHNENMHTCCAVPQKWDFQHFIATPPSSSLLTSQWRHTCSKFVFCPHCNCVG